MKVLKKLADLERLKKGCVLTIGNFDGVHLGHQEILMAGLDIADKRKTEFVVMTFEPHPVAILHPEKALSVLTPLPLKIHLLKKYVDDCLVVLRCNKELLDLSPDDFVEKFLMLKIRPSVIVEGDDFNFGADRKGDIDTLKYLAAQNGFEVVVVAPKHVQLAMGQNIKVSSTIIRYMLESGHVVDANAALGRPYRLMEQIIPSRGIGKKLGFPTLNMKKPQQVIPAEGVYAGFVRIGKTTEDVLACKDKIPAVYSIGQARTYGDEFPLLIEAHLLKENVDSLVGKYMTMDFIERVRSQHKFKTSEELSAQIAKDCQKAKEILAEEKH